MNRKTELIPHVFKTKVMLLFRDCSRCGADLSAAYVTKLCLKLSQFMSTYVADKTLKTQAASGGFFTREFGNYQEPKKIAFKCMFITYLMKFMLQ